MLDPCAITSLVKKFVCSLGVLLCRITQTGLIFPHQSMSVADILDYIEAADFGSSNHPVRFKFRSFTRLLMVAFFFLDWFWGPLDLLASSSSPVCIHCCYKKSHLFVIWLHVFCSIFSHVMVVQSLHMYCDNFLLFLSQSCWCSRLANHKFHSECIVYMCGHWIYQRETIHSFMNAADVDWKLLQQETCQLPQSPPECLGRFVLNSLKD